VVENIQVEPHPSSGEIEVDDPDQILYRRSDPETLHSRLLLGEHGIIPTYLWCTGGEQGNRWALAELRGVEHADDGTEWFTSMSEANEAGYRRKAVKTNVVANPKTTSSRPEPAQEQQEAEEEDDSAYWAAYDQTPGPTPQQNRSPAPPTNGTNGRVQVGPTQSELEYFARYASEVQPALDPHDPDEEGAGPGESTLNGNTLEISNSHQHPDRQESLSDTANGTIASNSDRRDSPCDDQPEHIESIDEDRLTALNHPRPSSSASSNSIERLEREAESHSNAELAIKQHISTDMKSLFRLARASGIDREEFERIIKRELEVLPLLEQDH